MVTSSLSFAQICEELVRLDQRLFGENGVQKYCDQAYQCGNAARSQLGAFNDPKASVIAELIASGMDYTMNATRGNLYQYRGNNEYMREILQG